ncbi:MAG: hypothetical protein MMC33_008681 [Icmadophila ericetorum]|nr:hypothetical protein [Icmadophila ericetorum]
MDEANGAKAPMSREKEKYHPDQIHHTKADGTAPPLPNPNKSKKLVDNNKSKIVKENTKLEQKKEPEIQKSKHAGTVLEKASAAAAAMMENRAKSTRARPEEPQRQRPTNLSSQHETQPRRDQGRVRKTQDCEEEGVTSAEIEAHREFFFLKKPPLPLRQN